MADIIVIGASLGGVEALRKLASDLPTDLPAAIFVVQHTGSGRKFHLPGLLDRVGKLPTSVATDDAPIEHGHIVVAPPDLHLMLMDGRIKLSRGPHENRVRPSIDVLFRSAAAAQGPRVVGVVMTGMLDDGSSGLLAIKRCGGITVVQDPDDASFAEMPLNAMKSVEPDYCVPLAELGTLLNRLSREPVGKAPPVPDDVAFEVRMSAGQPANNQVRDRTEAARCLAALNAAERCGK